MIASRRAFTLLELLVATAVVVIFVVFTAEFTAAALKRTEGVNSKLRTNMQARVVMDWITRDLQTALKRKDGGEWLRMEPSPLDVGSLALPMSRLMLFSQAGESYGPNGTLSGPAAISYEADYCDPVTLQDKPRWNTTALFRVSLDPQVTFDEGFVNRTPKNLATEFWDSLRDGPGKRGSEHLLIQNLAGFEIAFEFTAGNSTTIKSSPQAPFLAAGNGTLVAGGTSYPGATLASAEVTLWLLEPGGALALRRAAEGQSIDSTEFLTVHARPFVRKILLPTR